MSKSREYWRKRIEEEQRHRIQSDVAIQKEMVRIYEYHLREIEKTIRDFEYRFASKNGIPIAELIKRVDEMDVVAFQEKARRYVETKDFSAVANRELALYNYKMSMNRMEMLQQELNLQLIELAEDEHRTTGNYLTKEARETAEFQAGILGHSVPRGAEFTTIMQSIIDTPFHGVTWKTNISKRHTALQQVVSKAMQDYLIKGQNPTDAIPILRREFGYSAKSAKRLLVTEGARVASQMQKRSFEQYGYDEYEYIAEPTACDICKPFDGKVFKVKDMEPGENAAPMHPYCRCSTGAYYSEEKSDNRDDNLPYKDITDSFISKIEHQPNLSILSEYEKEGVKYVVDGKRVVLDFKNSEYEAANWLSRKTGAKVEMVPRVNYPPKVRTPDILVDGEKWDIKAPTGGGGHVIDNNSKKAKEQAPNILFDMTNSPLSDEEILKQLHQVYKLETRGLEKAVIKRYEEVIAVYKKTNKKS